MQHYHAVVWLDHREAKVFFFDRDSFDEVGLASGKPHQHLHHKAGSVAGKRSAEDHHFYHSIVETLQPAKEWLILGPSTAKLEFVKHVHKHDAKLADHIVGVESADHPTDKQVVAHARAYFKSADRMRKQL